jgi:hypothetical protein
MSTPFTHAVNLDCPNDLAEFLERHEPARGRRLANQIGFKGRNAVKAADGLMNYAHNKRAAISCRSRGDTQEALKYEAICDMIYREDIQPLTDCW